MESDIQSLKASAASFQGKTVYTVQDLIFASALVAVGVPLFDLPKLVRLDGKLVTTFLFQESDPSGTVVMSECAYAATEPLRFMTEHPDHPLSYALAGLLHYGNYRHHMETARAIVPMRASQDSGPVVHFAENSRKHRLAIKMGWCPVPGPSDKKTPLEILSHLQA